MKSNDVDFVSEDSFLEELYEDEPDHEEPDQEETSEEEPDQDETSEEESDQEEISEEEIDQEEGIENENVLSIQSVDYDFIDYTNYFENLQTIGIVLCCLLVGFFLFDAFVHGLRK